MPLPLRRYYTDLMIKAKKKESDEIDKMNNNPAFKNSELRTDYNILAGFGLKLQFYLRSPKEVREYLGLG